MQKLEVLPAIVESISTTAAPSTSWFRGWETGPLSLDESTSCHYDDQ
jgi:hypothetical protein